MWPALALALLVAGGWQVWLSGQQPAPAKAAPAGNRFEFEVIQSYDARYEGDTPGHIGRSGGLDGRKPHVALGDPVFRGEQQVGKVTGLSWSRGQGSLEVEFDPVGGARVSVGDAVWLALDGQANPAAK
jgi:hypothetical protein